MKKAIIDIDGVLNYYPKTFIDFCKTKNIYYSTLQEIKEAISYNQYKQLKEEYRQSDFKHNAKIRKGSKELIQYLQKNNYLIYIITSRPLFKNNQLEKTICWLKNNKIHYDYIYCTIKKDFTIFEKFGHIDLIIEDNIDNLNNIKNINGSNAKYYNVYNLDNINKQCEFKRVDNLNEIIEDMEKIK